MDDYAGTQAGLTDRPRPESPQLPRQEKIFFARRRCKHPSDPEKMLHLLNPTSLPNYKNINVNTNWQLSNIPVIETMQNMARIECHILTRFEKRFELVASLE